MSTRNGCEIVPGIWYVSEKDCCVGRAWSHREAAGGKVEFGRRSCFYVVTKVIWWFALTIVRPKVQYEVRVYLTSYCTLGLTMVSANHQITLVTT